MGERVGILKWIIRAEMLAKWFLRHLVNNPESVRAASAKARIPGALGHVFRLSASMADAGGEKVLSKK